MFSLKLWYMYIIHSDHIYLGFLHLLVVTESAKNINPITKIHAHHVLITSQFEGSVHRYPVYCPPLFSIEKETELETRLSGEEHCLLF